MKHHQTSVSTNETKTKVNEIFVKNCQYCNNIFETKYNRVKTCSKECRYKLRSRESVVNRTCLVCSKQFRTTAHNADDYCSVLCRSIAKSVEKFTGIEGVDYIVCPVCKIRTRQISPGHAKMHGFDSIKHMQEVLAMPLVTCTAKKAMSAGENNPGYQHGGKFSHFSKNFIYGYDEEKHRKLIEDNRNRDINQPELFKTNIAYWLKQTNGNEELAKLLYKKFQTRDLSWFVEKYGKEEGIKRHKAKTEKWINTLQSKPIAELLDINRRKVNKTKRCFSKAEKELFSTLKLVFPSLTDQWAICHNPLEKKKKFYLYDMALDNKIIEYNGDFWHANPSKFNESFICPYNKLTFNQIHERDLIKINTAKENGYKVMIVWETDYKSNPKKVIEECIKFLTQ